MTQQERYAETDQALKTFDKAFWVGVVLLIICL